MVGHTQSALGGSVFARRAGGLETAEVPVTDFELAMKIYRAYYEGVKKGWILSTHDVSEGGVLVALAEMGFSLQAGLNVAWPDSDVSKAGTAFGEGPAQILVEVSADQAEAFAQIFNDSACRRIGTTTDGHRNLRVPALGVDEPLTELKKIWQNGLGRYY